jgi:hypothetical protein
MQATLGQHETRKSLSETLADLTERLPEGTVSLQQILELVGREGMLMTCMFLTIPFMVPVSIPGVSTVFGLAILLIGVGLMANRLPFLPRALLRRTAPSAKLKAALRGGAKFMRRIEKIARPRHLWLTHGPTLNRLNGLALILGGVLLMAPFGLVPFSNTLPGLAILFLAAGMLERDGICVLIGHGLNVGTMVYFGVLVFGAYAAGKSVIH